VTPGNGIPPWASPYREDEAHGASDDLQALLQRTRDLVWQALNRRDRTVAEVRRLLAAKQVEPTMIDAVISELLDSGYLDDARYAQRFAEDRRRLDAWGKERIERRLTALGVAREDICAAMSVDDHEDEDEPDRALEVLRRRFPQPPADDRERARALGLLVRRGYDADSAYEAIRRHTDRTG
jgi:regulatory protein